MMVPFFRLAFRFFKVAVDLQAYLNLVYLLAAFPLGVLYFALLATLGTAGIALLVVWAGIPILLALVAGWWILASFERLLAVHWLKEDVPPMAMPSGEESGFWTRAREHFSNPVTWKSPLYLLVKFPLGTATFSVLITLISLTLTFLLLPVLQEILPGFEFGVFLDPNRSGWRIDTPAEALLCTLLGVILWPLTLHISNGLAWVHAKFARVMLGSGPIGSAFA